MSQPNFELVTPAQKPSVASQRAWDETTRPLHWNVGPPLVSLEGRVSFFPSNPQHRLAVPSVWKPFLSSMQLLNLHSNTTSPTLFHTAQKRP